jgi:hypothetical protein
MSNDMQRDALDLWQRVQQRGPLVRETAWQFD